MFSILRSLGYVHGASSFDNFIFKLCYRWTVLLLVVLSFIVTCKLHFGYSIYCISADISVAYATVKCYSGFIYAKPESFKSDDVYSYAPEDKRLYLNYYPWVNLLLLLHAFNFYLPHLLWKSYERGYMCKLTAGIQKHVDKEEKHDHQLNRLAKHFYFTLGKHKIYTLLYILFEIFNFIVSLSHALWLPRFFNIGSLSNNVSIAFDSWSDFKDFYFPGEGFCSFRTVGSSGDWMRNGARCLLPMNDLYVKVFWFLNGWYIAITILTGLMIIYRFFLIIPPFRMLVTKISSPLSLQSVYKSVCFQLSYTDWFYMSRLRYAMTDVDFAHFIDKITLAAQGKDPHNNKHECSNDMPKHAPNSNVTSAL